MAKRMQRESEQFRLTRRAVRACVFVGSSEVVLGSWSDGWLDRGFESGEAFFEDSGDSEQSEHGWFGDVAAVLRVCEQRCAQE